MKDSSDINRLHSEVILLKIRKKSTEELISTWMDNNHKGVSQEEYDAIERVLLERLGQLPEQRKRQEMKGVSSIGKKTTIDDNLEEPYFIQRIRAIWFAFLIFIVIVLFAGVTVAFGKISDLIFWNFITNASSERIESIEIREVSDSNPRNNQFIIVEDKEAISRFAKALSTIQEYEPHQISGRHNLRILVKLNFIETIEIHCFTIQGSNRVIVYSVFISPNFLASSVTTAIFPESNFYNWLISVGVNLQ